MAGLKRHSLREQIDTTKPLSPRGWRMDGMMKPEYRAAMGYRVRQAVRYNLAELQQMLAAYDMGFSIEEIAEDHQRTENGVGGRLMDLIERRARGLPLMPEPVRRFATLYESARKHSSASARARQ